MTCGKSIKRLLHFIYLGTNISYEKDHGIEIKPRRFEHMYMRHDQ